MPTDLLSRATAWLGRVRHSHAAKSISYRRGSASITLMATPGNNPAFIDSAEQVNTTVEERDWLFRPADLVLDGRTTKPQRGDVIVVTENSEARMFQVAATSGEQAWRYGDVNANWIRVHTKFIGNDEAP